MPDYALRLARLRTLLSEEGVDGLLITRADAYLGEYVPASAERLSWLTGFTGSAGFAVILRDQAAVFSDGRYQLQMRKEVDQSLWSIQHMFDTPGPDWLAHHGGGARIGYDPRMVSETERIAYEAAGCRLHPLARNLIDTLWDDQPAEPATTVFLQPASVTGTAPAERIDILRQILTRDQQDAVVLTDPTAVAWLLTLRARDLPYLPVALCTAIVGRDGAVSLFIAAERVPEDIAIALPSTVTRHDPAALPAALRALSGQTVRLDPQRSGAWFWQHLRAAGAQPVAGADPCLLPRACKTAAERAGMRQAHLLDGIALSRFLHWLEGHGIGRTEVEVAERLLAFRLENEGCTGASFASIAAAGANAAIMHYGPTPQDCATLEAGSFFLIDSGGQYLFGTTDVTRTIWLGQGAPPAAWCDHYTRVLKGLIGLTNAVFPAGTPGYRLDPLARHALWEAHLDFDHGAGHGLGSYLSVHEWPLGFTRRPVLDAIEEHMILTNEPGYYANGSHGIRLENAMETCRSDDTGQFLRFETLTLAPIDRRGITLALLTPEERAWVDAFHARVEAAISPLLEDEDTRSWLRAACAPL